MKIDLNAVDRDQFMVHEHLIGGETVFLVQPQHIGVVWTKENKIFRSSVWNAAGELVSAGFPKFVNWGESPAVFPLPKSLIGATIMEKIDGTLLIVSMYKGNLIFRTRGTVDAYAFENGFELESFKEYADKLLSVAAEKFGETWPISYLFEWVSPKQRIVLSYGEDPKFFFVGAVDHYNYSILPQINLDVLAECYDLIRPLTYTFSDIADLLNNVETWKGKEGVCIYSNNDQAIHKVKSAWYLALHHLKSELASFDKVIDTWFLLGRPDYLTFYAKIVEQFDFELANQVQSDMSRICDGWKEVLKIIQGMEQFVQNTLKPLLTRKDMAMKVFSSYSQTNRASFIFKLLDGKELANDDLKKLLYQVLKK